MTQREERKTLENKRNQLANEIDRLKDELNQREAQLPAHSIRPHQVLAIEELEEKIKRKQEQLRYVEKELSEPQDSLGGGRIPSGSPD
jgi:DNA repair exonuclease SbcCD ATPase subunit